MKLKIQNLIQKIDMLFGITVVIPTVIALLYYGIFASDVYVSESRFVVRSPDKPSTSGLGLILKGAGFSSAGDEIFAAQEYIKSRDALSELNKDDFVKKAYGRGSISFFDRFDPVGWNGSFEDLYDYFQKKVVIQEEASTSITSLVVRAYDPKDAYAINQRLVGQAEALINKLNERGRKDLVGYAQKEVEEAKRVAIDAGAALARYRNSSGIVDPEKQAEVQIQLVSKLQDELISSEAQLVQLRSVAPDNSQIPVLKARIRSLKSEIDGQSGRVAGSGKSIALKAERYQRLYLESQFADRQLAVAMSALQDAKNEARRKQAYLERIAEPTVPDEAVEPRRLRGIFATLVLGLIAWAIATMLLAGVREHRE